MQLQPVAPIHKVLINPFNSNLKQMSSLCSLPHTPPINLFFFFFFFVSPTCFSPRLFPPCEGLHNKANDNPGSLILKKKEAEVC